MACTQLDAKSAADGDSPETPPSPDQSTGSDGGGDQSDATPPAYDSPETPPSTTQDNVDIHVRSFSTFCFLGWPVGLEGSIQI